MIPRAEPGGKSEVEELGNGSNLRHGVRHPARKCDLFPVVTRLVRTEGILAGPCSPKPLSYRIVFPFQASNSTASTPHGTIKGNPHKLLWTIAPTIPIATRPKREETNRSKRFGVSSIQTAPNTKNPAVAPNCVGFRSRNQSINWPTAPPIDRQSTNANERSLKSFSFAFSIFTSVHPPCLPHDELGWSR